jgi:hypothetical protein
VFPPIRSPSPFGPNGVTMHISGNDAPARVLLIAGSGRSGSTVLASVLGSVPGVFSGGEIRYLFSRGLQDNRLCGCGVPFRDCSTWGAVLERVAAENPAGLDAAGLAETAARWGRIRRLHRLLAVSSGHLPADLAHYAAVLDGLYRAVPAVTGASLIVDSSKLPAYGRLLDLLPGVDLRVVHLVRDPRAAAYSWSRHKPLADGARAREMERISPAKSAVLWNVWNVTARLLWSGETGRYLRLPYESLLAEPRPWVERILAMAGHPANLDDVFVGDRIVRLQPTHTVAGNPDRLRRGDVALRLDDEWRHRMRRLDRVLVAMMTAPVRPAVSP